MKQSVRVVLATIISVSLFACKSSNKSDTVDSAAIAAAAIKKDSAARADTAGLAAFKAQKRQRYEDSLKNVGAARQRVASTTTRSTRSSSGTRTSYAASGYGARSTYSNQAAVKKSHAARNGALIGAGAGALTGALVTKKNRGVGALIGGVAGAGAGFGVGKIIENKQKKKQEQQ